MDGPPLQSGNPLIDAIFNLCVQILLSLAALLGVSYNTINIWIFCVIWPLLTILLICAVVFQHLKIRRMREEYNGYHAVQRDMIDFQAMQGRGRPNARRTGTGEPEKFSEPAHPAEPSQSSGR